MKLLTSIALLTVATAAVPAVADPVNNSSTRFRQEGQRRVESEIQRLEYPVESPVLEVKPERCPASSQTAPSTSSDDGANPIQRKKSVRVSENSSDRCEAQQPDLIDGRVTR